MQVNYSKLILQFRVSLLGVSPPVWRRIQVPNSYSFWDLHVAIQDAMGWLDYHLHQFEIKKPRGRKAVRIGFPDEDFGQHILAGWEVPLSDYFVAPGVSASYEYDFGDGWSHEVLLEGVLIKDTSLRYPVCPEGARACPPEDCGGIHGYESLLKTLALPNNSEYEEMVNWLKNHAKSYWPYKPDYFSPAEIHFWNPSKRLRMALGEHG